MASSPLPPVTFVEGFDEFRALARARPWIGPVGWTFVLVVAPLATLAPHVSRHGLSSLLEPSRFLILAAATACGVAVVALAMMFVDRVLLPRIFRRSAFANERITIVFEPEGVAWSTDGTAGSYRWCEIRSAIVQPDHLVLARSRFEGLAIPRRALPDDAAFDALVRYTRERLPDRRRRNR